MANWPIHLVLAMWRPHGSQSTGDGSYVQIQVAKSHEPKYSKQVSRRIFTSPAGRASTLAWHANSFLDVDMVGVSHRKPRDFHAHGS